MKKRRPKPRKKSRKRTPPTSTPSLGWQMPLSEPTPIRRTRNPPMSGAIEPILPPRQASTNAVVDEVGGTVEPFPAAADQANLKAEEELRPSDETTATVVRAPPPQAIIPTMYPAEPGGPIIVQNQITINIHSTEFRELNRTLKELLQEMRRSRSNEIAGEVRDQLTAEITAGRTLLTAPKANRNWIDLLLVKPLKYIAEKGGSAVISKLATAALEWLFKLL
jgi:hypothetical protein